MVVATIARASTRDRDREGMALLKRSSLFTAVVLVFVLAAPIALRTSPFGFDIYWLVATVGAIVVVLPAGVLYAFRRIHSRLYR